MEDDRTQSMPRLSLKSAMGVSMDGGWVTKTCLASHPLKEFRTFYDGYTCSHCTLAFPRRTTLRGCRKCDYDICRKCDSENAKRSSSLPSSRQPNSRRSSASSRRSSRCDQNEETEQPSNGENSDKDDNDDDDESIPRSISAPTPYRHSLSPPPLPSEELSNSEEDDEKEKDSLSLDSFHSEFTTSHRHQVTINTESSQIDSSSSSNMKPNRRISDITLLEDEEMAPQNEWAPGSPKPSREDVLLKKIHKQEEEEEAFQQQQYTDSNQNENMELPIKLQKEEKQEEISQNNSQVVRSAEGDLNSISLDRAKDSFHKHTRSSSSSSSSPIKVTRPKVKKRPSPALRRKSSSTTPSNRAILQTSEHVMLSDEEGSTNDLRTKSPPSSPIIKPSSPTSSNLNAIPLSSSYQESPPRTPKSSRSMSASSVLDSPRSPNRRKKMISNQKKKKTSQGVNVVVDDDGGIDDEEMFRAYEELKGIVEGTAQKPDNVKLLNQGKIGRGGWWTLHGLVDVDTGLLQLYLEGHFGVPLSIMEKCVLDESFQKTYDPFLRIKQVIATVKQKTSSLLENDKQETIDIRSGGGGGGGVQSETDVFSGKMSEVLHHEIKFPAPFSNRDYVFYRRRKLEKGRFTYVQRDVEPRTLASQYVPPKKGVIRAGNGKYWQLGMGVEETHFKPRIETQKDENSELGRCIMVVRSQDNIEGKVPKWLSNLAAKQGAPGYVKQLEKAAISRMIEEGMITKAEARKLWR